MIGEGMPYEIIWGTNGILVQFWGSYDHKVSTRANIEIYSDSRFKGLKYAIWDLSGISELRITVDEAVIPAMQDKLASERLPNLKLAMIVQDEPARKICNSYVAHCQNSGMEWEFMVADSMECIRAWGAS